MGDHQAPLFRDQGLWLKLVALAVILVLASLFFAAYAPRYTGSILGLGAGITLVWFISLGLSRSATGLPSPTVKSLPPRLVLPILGIAIGVGLTVTLNQLVFDAVTPIRNLTIMAAGIFVLATASRAFTTRIETPQRVLLVGADETTLELLKNLSDYAPRQFSCVGIVDDRLRASAFGGVIHLGSSSAITTIYEKCDPDLIVCSQADLQAPIVQSLLDSGITDVRVLNSTTFHEYAFQRVAGPDLSANWFAGLFDITHREYSPRTKRIFDVIAASVALLVAWPVILGTALLIRLSGPGPILFRQQRVGEGGKLFEIFKFRTMIPEAETGDAVWAGENDPRITPIGGFLRKTRLDELPQLWNVIRGEMSIVGPRPERPEFLSLLTSSVPFWSRRDLLKPGITGWAQVQYAYTADVSGAANKLSYDLYYLKHRSLALDLLILLKTVKVVFLRVGAR